MFLKHQNPFKKKLSFYCSRVWRSPPCSPDCGSLAPPFRLEGNSVMSVLTPSRGLFTYVSRIDGSVLYWRFHDQVKVSSYCSNINEEKTPTWNQIQDCTHINISLMLCLTWVVLQTSFSYHWSWTGAVASIECIMLNKQECVLRLNLIVWLNHPTNNTKFVDCGMWICFLLYSILTATLDKSTVQYDAWTFNCPSH